MILTETHSIKRKNKDLYEKVDRYCFASKNLRNYTNYIIKQCSRISYKLKDGEILDSWEKGFIYRINCAIYEYNHTGKEKHTKYIDNTNGFVADAYFLCWYLKRLDVYKEMPSATSAQVCIQMICRDWKAFYQGMKQWKKNPASMLGRPRPPRYYDKETGRNWLVLTYQNIKVDSNRNVELPKAFEGIRIRARHDNITQVRIITTGSRIKIQILYKVADAQSVDSNEIMGIDLNIDNLVVAVFSNTHNPVIIDGKPLKANNQWYNKETARLQELAKTLNNRYATKRMCRLTDRRNNKVKDYLHKVSRMVVDIAVSNNIGIIVIGNNQGWKQQVKMGKKTNQVFVGIPYLMLIQMIEYKANLVGITVKVVNEAYTSGTSYLDGELPTENYYNKKRRKTRGCFVSNTGEIINADVNGAYQIIKKYQNTVPIKHREKVTKLKVA
ncbi:putative transposase [Lachnospiraceae bacterium KHCPX20]|nr:putative transposase [Lachnospiraceae bacterium KHCPX20]